MIDNLELLLSAILKITTHKKKHSRTDYAPFS